jgi:putative hemolysin
LPETNARAGVESAGYVRCLERGGTRKLTART